MSFDDAPPPSPNGYQPVPGEGLSFVDVEVRPSRQFQTVGVTGRVTFPQPRSLAEALPAIEDAYVTLSAYANDKLDQLGELRETSEQGQAKAKFEQAAKPPVQQAADAGATLTWQYGEKPKGDEKVRYLPTSVYPKGRFLDDAKASIAEAGIDPEQVVIFDDRTGNYGMESGNKSYSAGKAKARQGSALETVVGDRYVAWIDFGDDGRVYCKVTKDGESFVNAQKMLAVQQGQAQQAQQALAGVPGVNWV